MKDLNISHDTIEVLEENIGRKISDIALSSMFPDMSPRAREIKSKQMEQNREPRNELKSVRSINI